MYFITITDIESRPFVEAHEGEKKGTFAIFSPKILIIIVFANFFPKTLVIEMFNNKQKNIYIFSKLKLS